MDSILSLVLPLSDVLGTPAVPTALLSLLILGAVAHLLIRKLVQKLGSFADTTAARWDDVVYYAISPPAEWAMWICVAYISLGLFEQATSLRMTLLQLADTGAILLIGWLLHRVSAGIEMELLAEHRGLKGSDDRASINAVARLARITIWVLVVLMVMQSLGVSVSGLLAFGGIGGIAVGFAAKDLLANFLGCVSIYLYRPFAVGDWIR
ncbi:MAG: mechanosensitive ion channel family protein, partial [Halieaceae bacterium]